MIRVLLTATAVCLALAGCQDQDNPRDIPETAQERADRGEAQTRGARAVQDPETGVYVPAVAGDPGGTAASGEPVPDVYGATGNPARDGIPQGMTDETIPDPARGATLRERDAEAELVRARRECDDVPEAARSDCRDQIDQAHAEALRQE